jgi:hypothetical protein
MEVVVKLLPADQPITVDRYRLTAVSGSPSVDGDQLTAINRQQSIAGDQLAATG